MTNALTTALVQAGLPDMTMTKRIWLWIQDHPGCTIQDVYKGLKIPSGIAGTRVSDLHNRRMVTKTPAFRNTIKGKADVFELRVTTKEYELLTRVGPTHYKRKKENPKLALEDSQKVANQVVRQMMDNAEIAHQPRVEAPGFAIVRKNSVDIESMPVGEARALYQKLHAIFGK